FFPRTLRGGINRRSRFVHDGNEKIQLMLFNHGAHEGLRITGSRSIADCNTPHAVLLHEVENDLFCAFEILLRLCRIDRLVLQELSCGINDGELTPRALSWINPDHTDLSSRRSEQQ